MSIGGRPESGQRQFYRLYWGNLLQLGSLLHEGKSVCAPRRRYTEAQYLAIERDLETKHEFHRGEMFAMSGASRQHNRITFNLAAILHGQLKGCPCEAYVNDMRVTVESTTLCTYPDVVITCNDPRSRDTLLNLQVSIEVLSDSTENTTVGRSSNATAQFPPCANTY